jgi:hypothetical protein
LTHAGVDPLHGPGARRRRCQAHPGALAGLESGALPNSNVGFAVAEQQGTAFD